MANETREELIAEILENEERARLIAEIEKNEIGDRSTASALSPTTWPITQALSGNIDQALEGVDAFAGPALRGLDDFTGGALGSALGNTLETVSNIPSSGLKYADDITYPIRHPIDTAEGLGNLASGLLHKTPLYPGVQEDEAYPDAVGEHFSNRYGGLSELGNTIKTDPVGFVGDAAGLFSALGAVPKLAKLGQVGRTIEPVNLAAKGASKLTGLGENIPSNLYGTVLKPSAPDDPARRSRIIQQLLDDGIRPNQGGVDRLRSKKAESEAATQQALAAANARLGNPRVPGPPLLSEAQQYLNTLRRNSAVETKSKNAGQNTLDDFRNQMPPTMSLNELHDWKRTHGRNIKWDSAKGDDSPKNIKNTVKKHNEASGRALLEQLVPKLKTINPTYADRIEGTPMIKKATNRLKKLDPLGLSTRMMLSNLLPMAAGGAVGHFGHGSPGAIAAGLLTGAGFSAANSPKFKTELAFLLNNIGNNKAARDFRARPWESKPMSELVAQGLLQTGRNTKSSEEVKSRRGRNKR